MRRPKLPKKPGVYIFLDKEGRPLYVGKAGNLRSRVGFYFRRGIGLGDKTSLMIGKTFSIRSIVTDSEVDALLLEAELIKKFKPHYNVRWKDDKNYKYIKIAKDRFSRVAAARRPKEDGGLYFGPYPVGDTKALLRTLRRIFPFRDCSKTRFLRCRKLNRPCLYDHLGLCPSPCVGKITPLHYSRVMESLWLFLSGKKKAVELAWEKEMRKAAGRQDFERAAEFRRKLRNLKLLSQSPRPPADYLKDPNLLEDQRRIELAALARQLSNIGYASLSLGRIEAYDISNLRGKSAVGSMAVFIEGEKDASQYRRFKIRLKDKPDDAAMLSEVLGRRLARLEKKGTADSSFGQKPDFILVDGGKPQVAAVLRVLRRRRLEIPVAGLAKKEEKLVNHHLEEFDINLERALRLLQRIRDEAHRFALSYHRCRARRCTSEVQRNFDT